MQTEICKSLGQTAGVKSKDCHLTAAHMVISLIQSFDLVVQMVETNREEHLEIRRLAGMQVYKLTPVRP